MDYKKIFNKWYNSNPIRKYRKEHKMSSDILASILGVAAYTVQRWEKGTMPNEENMEKLKEIIGDDFEQQWEDWVKNKPM